MSDLNVALIKSRLSLLEKSFEASQGLDQSLAALYDAGADEESETLAQREAEKLSNMLTRHLLVFSKSKRGFKRRLIPALALQNQNPMLSLKN